MCSFFLFGMMCGGVQYVDMLGLVCYVGDVEFNWIMLCCSGQFVYEVFGGEDIGDEVDGMVLVCWDVCFVLYLVDVYVVCVVWEVLFGDGFGGVVVYVIGLVEVVGLLLFR